MTIKDCIPLTAMLAMVGCSSSSASSAMLAQAWGVDSRDGSTDPHRSLYPVGIS